MSHGGVDNAYENIREVASITMVKRTVFIVSIAQDWSSGSTPKKARRDVESMEGLQQRIKGKLDARRDRKGKILAMRAEKPVLPEELYRDKKKYL